MFFFNFMVVLTVATAQVIIDSIVEMGEQLLPARTPDARVGTKAIGFEGSVKSLLVRTDDQFQNFVCARIDPLLAGHTRERYLKELMMGESRTLTTEEKHANRRFGVALLAPVILGLVYFTSLPLMPLVYASALYNLWPWIYLAYHSLFKEHRLSIVLTMMIFYGVMWSTGHYVLGSFSILFFALYHKIRFITQVSSRQNLIEVFDQHTQTVWMLKNGVELETAIESVGVGDIVVLDSGQMIPIDGTVIRGSALVDQHRLTGESQAIEKKEDDSVLASTVIVAGRLWVRVEKTGSDTTAARILKILTQTVDDYWTDMGKSLADVEKTLYPMLLCGVLSGMVAGPVAGVAALGANYVFSMIHFKMITLLNALNSCANHSILVKDGRALDALAGIDTLVFDKTGTLTLAQPQVVGIHALAGHSESEVLQLAATAEHRQTHPIALAILASAKERDLELCSIDGSDYEIGYGIKVMIKETQVLVGSQRFMTLQNITLPDTLMATIESPGMEGKSWVYVAEGGELAGVIELDACVRPEAREVLDELKASGIRLYIISGDTEAPTKRLADALGVDGYFANVLPMTKAELVKQLKADGRKVGFVGDGINDAIALREADVSVSFRSATSVASDNAQIVLMSDSLHELQILFKVAKTFNKTLSHNLHRSLALSPVGVAAAIFLPYKFLIVHSLYIGNLVIGFFVATRPLLAKNSENKAVTNNTQKRIEYKLTDKAQA